MSVGVVRAMPLVALAIFVATLLLVVLTRPRGLNEGITALIGAALRATLIDPALPAHATRAVPPFISRVFTSSTPPHPGL